MRAGHTRPLHVPRDGSALLIDDGFSPAIGLLPGRFGADEPAHLRLAPGDRFCLYSDGITEARHPCNGFFSEGRLAEALQSGRDASVGDATRGVLRAVVDWAESGEFDDDISILTLERLPAEEPCLWRGAPQAHALASEIT